MRFWVLFWLFVSSVSLFAGFFCTRWQLAATIPLSSTQAADQRGASKFAVLQSLCAPVSAYKVVKTYPHDPEAFTQGLFFDNGFLYESTGLYGRSSIRKVELETGEIICIQSVPDHLFGEGLVKWKDTFVQLTWRSQTGLVYAAESLERLRTFSYPGEGWGLTENGEFLIVSDGSAIIRFWDPNNFQEVRRIEVTDHGNPVKHINELEYIKGKIYANVWHTDLIARISPETGEVLGWLDLAGLRKGFHAGSKVGVLNGIAYDPLQDRIFVTGKFWPSLFEIKIIDPGIDP